ncbi:hypothetical protein LDENG_00155310 [Lucifuga dentata]|nr:hypothetical protein LDENG_00155310 [Lucifuga dentata]
MHTYSDRVMAIPRMFNSNTPFIIVMGGSELSFLGKEESQECEEEKDSLAQAMAPHLSWVMQHGTAKLVATGGHDESEENPYISIVAQAEREDLQEFSPTNIQCTYSRNHRSFSRETVLISDAEDEDFGTLPHYHSRRKQWRKTRTRQIKEGGEERPIIRGLWVQEIDWLKSVDSKTTSSPDIIPPPLGFTDSVTPLCSHADCSLKVDPCSHVCEGLSADFNDMLLSEDWYGLIDTKDTSSSDSRGGSDSESIRTHESDSDSSCCVGNGFGYVHSSEDTSEIHSSTCVPDSFGQEASVSDMTFDLMGVSGFNSTAGSTSSWQDVSDSFKTFTGTCSCTQNPLVISDSAYTASTVSITQCSFRAEDVCEIDTVLGGLRGKVAQLPRHFVSSFFKDLIKHTVDDRKKSLPVNEGLIFHTQLQPNRSKYREGEEYCILHHIQNGSYGDVFCVRDKRTGFKCAAKRIPLSHFSIEEASTWNALNSPRVVELFGAVREGLNIVLFMDLKPACLAQLLKEMNSLPEDLALHYLHQTLGALEHLHHRHVLHLDVKVDNVLLSVDCRDTFLCDFGLSKILDDNGLSTKPFRGSAFPGTETHMAPEVARGDQLCGKADVWSSCCMLLHMLNGCHPWIRYYSHPLCLQIVNEPPPLWEVPSNCNNFTAKVFRAGLQKDPDRRASARELKRKTTKALRAVGGLSHWSIKSAHEKLHHGKSWNEDTPRTVYPEISSTPTKTTIANSAPAMYWVSPWRTNAVDEDSSNWEDSDSEIGSDSDQVETDSLDKEWESQPKSLQDNYFAEDKDWKTDSDSEVDIYMGEEEYLQTKWLKNDRDYEGDWEEEEEEEEEEGNEEEEEEEWDSSMSTGYCCALQSCFPLLQKCQQTTGNSWGSEPELEYLRDGVTMGNINKTPSPEPRDNPPSCFSCSDTSHIDASDQDSDHWSDDLSSGVFSSCNSQTDGHLEWLDSANQPLSHCFEGVNIWIENIHGDCLRICESRQVKVGHVAIGISDQISEKAFTLETLDRRMVSFEQEILESCLWLRCVPAPDKCQRWNWRIKDGKIELRE